MALDDIDSAMDDYFKESAEVPSQVVERDGVDDAMDEYFGDKEQSLKQSMYLGAQKNPDQHAKILEVASKSKVSPRFAEENYDALDQILKRNQVSYSTMNKRYPKMSQFLQDENNAAIAHDDLDGLKKLEDQINDHSTMDSILGAINSGYRNLSAGVANLNASVAKVPALVQDAVLWPQNQINKYLGREQSQSPEWLRDNPISKHYEEAAEGLKTESVDWDIEEEVAKGNWDRAGMAILNKVAYNAPSSLAIIGASFAGLGPQAAVALGTTVAADVNARSQDKVSKGEVNADPSSAVENAVLQGGAEVIAEKLGTLRVFGQISKSVAKQYGNKAAVEVLKSIGKSLFKGFAVEGSEEFVTTFAQDFADSATMNTEFSVDQTFKSARESFVIGGISGAGMTAPAATIHGVAQGEKVKRANRARDFYKSFGETAEATKLRERLPEAQRKFIETLTQDSPVENIFINHEAFEEYFQGKEINPAQAAKELGVEKEYNEAKEAGHDIKIPLSSWATKFVGTEHYEPLSNDIKFNQDDLSVNELKAEEKRTKEELEQVDKESKGKELSPNEKLDQSEEEIHAKFTEQIKQAGYNDKDAKTLATIFRGFRVIGEREGIDPMQLFNEYQVRIHKGESPQAAAQAVLNQGSVDRTKQIDEVFNGPDALERYAAIPNSGGGRFLDTDLARTLDPVYSKDREGAILNQESTEKGAGMLMVKAYQERLKLPAKGPAQLLSGGSASGKTTYRTEYADQLTDSDVVYDSTSANYDHAKERVEQALKSGRPVLLTYIYAPFPKAVHGNAKRFKQTGRLVTPDYLAYTHVKSLEVFLKLQEEYKDNDLVDFEAFDNSKDKITGITIEKLRSLSYIKKGESPEKAIKRLEKYASKELSNEVEEIRTTEARVRSSALGSNESQSQKDSSSSQSQDGSGKKTLNQSAALNTLLSPLGFYSQVEVEVSKMDFNQIPGKDLANRIKNIQGIKKEELEVIGLNDWLDAREGKVTKEEVLNFIKENGVQVEQIVLSESFEGEGTSALGDIKWTEETRVDLDDRYLFDDNVNSEMEYYTSNPDDAFGDDYEVWKEQITAKHTDENGEVNQEAADQELNDLIQEKAEKAAIEYVRSDDYGSARYRVELDHDSDFYLEGSEDYGWYGGVTNKNYDSNLDEAKIQYMGDLIDGGHIEGNKSDLVREEDLGWKDPQAAIYPAQATITKRANQLIKTDRKRLEIKARDEYSYDFTDDIPKEKQAENLEDDIKHVAKDEARAYYRDPNNKKNTVSVPIDHPVLGGNITGNNIKGWALKYTVEDEDGNDVSKTKKLESKDMEAAKTEAVQKLIELEVLKPKQSKEISEKPVDVNAPTHPSNWEKHTVPGRENYKEILLTLPKSKDTFKYDTHFAGHKNFLAHARLSDRVDDKGRKTLFIEEIQSDWHQQGREHGYKKDDIELLRTEREDVEHKIEAIEKEYKNLRSSAMDQAEKNIKEVNEDQYRGDVVGDEYVKIMSKGEYFDMSNEYSSQIQKLEERRNELNEKILEQKDGVPDAPFKNTDAWASLVMKRLIRMATEQGYDAVAWTPADVHSLRWGTDVVSWIKRDPTKGWTIDEVEAGRFVVSDENDEIFTQERLLGDDVKYSEYAAAKEKSLSFETKEQAQAFIDSQKKLPAWTVGSTELSGGDAQGMDLEAEARRRGHLLERNGERVTTKEELRKVVLDVLSRDRSQRSVNSIVDNVWEQMQTKEEGVKRPRKEGMEFFYDKLIPDVTKKILKKLDPEAKIEVTEFETEGYKLGDKLKALEFQITDKIKQKAKEGFSLFQPGPQGPRGEIAIGKNKQFDISVFKNGDLSTILHEGGHFYLEMLGDLVQREGASQGLKDDYQKILDYLGVTSKEEIKTEHHEKWARSFEAYLMEGKAPTSELRQIFARFKVWLINIYKSLKNLDVELSDDIRGVMDRILATEAEIENAQAQQAMEPLFGRVGVYKVPDAEAELYFRSFEESKAHAEAQVTQKLLKDYERQRSAFYKEEKAKIREQIEKKYNEQRVYKAIDYLQKGKLPDGTPIKLDKESILKMWGAAGFERIKNRSGNYLYARKDGMHPDVAAQFLGFESGDDLLTQIANAPDKETLINEETEVKLMEMFPDSLTDGTLPQEAIDAVHNDERANIYKMELKFLASNNLPALKKLFKRIANPVVADKVIKAQARGIVGSKNWKEISPHRYLLAERKANKEAVDHLTKGDFDQAFKAKQRAFLNHELYRAATEARQYYSDQARKFKKVIKGDEAQAKSRDTDLVNAAKAILANFGIGRSDKTPESFLKQMKQYDEQKFSVIMALVDSATENTGHFKEIPFNDFVAMSESVNAIYELAGTAKRVMVDGEMIEEAVALDALNNQVAYIHGTPQVKPGYTKAVTEHEKTKMVWLGAKAALTKIEHWIDAIDADNPAKPFRKYVYEPVRNATTKYRLERDKVFNKFKGLFETYKDRLTTQIIKAQELDYTFKDKAELLMAILHSGNESNLDKLLRGRKWGEVDAEGVLDTSRWQAFINRMYREGVITKADMDFVQGVWDLMESMKPDAQKAHKELYGYYFNEITAQEIVTPFGTYKGGYIPAKTDLYMVEDGAIREEQEMFEKSNPNQQFPQTGRGFTKSRTQQYAAPLSLDLTMLKSHIDGVMRFSHIQPRVSEVARLLSNKDFRSQLAFLDPQIARSALIPWLERAASQRIVVSSSNGVGRYLDRGASFLRRTVAMQFMTLNIVNTLEQYTGLGVATTYVKAKYIRNGLVSYIRNPKQTTQDIFEKSDFMRVNQGSTIYEAQEAIDKIVLHPSTFQSMQEFSKQHTYFLQSATQNQVNTAVWLGGYEQAITEGMNERDAVQFADSVVRKSQGTSAPEDAAAYEKGTPLWRLFIMFTNYFNTLANINMGEVTRIHRELGPRKGMGKMFYVPMMTIMVTSVIGTLLRQMMSGADFDADDDDEYLDDAIALFFGAPFKTLLQTIPIAGQIANSLINRGNDNPFDDRLNLSPVFSIGETALGVPEAIAETVVDDLKKKNLKDILVTIGLLTATPIGALAKPAGYLLDVSEGEVDPESIFDFAQGLTTGKDGTL